MCYSYLMTAMIKQFPLSLSVHVPLTLRSRFSEFQAFCNGRRKIIVYERVSAKKADHQVDLFLQCTFICVDQLKPVNVLNIKVCSHIRSKCSCLSKF